MYRQEDLYISSIGMSLFSWLLFVVVVIIIIVSLFLILYHRYDMHSFCEKKKRKKNVQRCSVSLFCIPFDIARSRPYLISKIPMLTTSTQMLLHTFTTYKYIYSEYKDAYFIKNFALPVSFFLLCFITLSFSCCHRSFDSRHKIYIHHLIPNL